MGNAASESGEKAYKIKMDEVNKLGEGSFAEVYKIKRRRDKQLCAAKIFKIKLNNMTNKEEMGYERELKILKEADHPFIIEYIEEFPFKKNQLCIVTKLASGGDLQKYMRNKQFPEDEAMAYFAMILLGLDFLHSKNIFHRDLKPGNILIDELQDGMKILKIGDFGISKMNLQTMKQTQTTFGFDTTPAYKSPEVLNLNEATAKVDIWALGIILQQLLTSKHPFMRDDPWQTIIAIKDAQPSPLPSSIKEENKKIVSMLLQKNHEKRPDAQTLLSTKEVQNVVEALIKKIQKSDSEISRKIVQKNQLNFYLRETKEMQNQPLKQNIMQEQQQITPSSQNQFINKTVWPKPQPQSLAPQIVTQMVNDFLLNSKCAIEKLEKQYLYNLLGNKHLVTTLLFRGSESGWMKKDFHARCDNKGPTICLFKVKDGDCIGGYTQAQWSSDGKHVGQACAMLFNLSCKRHFPSKQTGTELYCYSYYGPCFSGGYDAELGACYEPFNGDENCESFAKLPGYSIPVDSAGLNMLTNEKDGKFSIIELEVWVVTEIKQ